MSGPSETREVRVNSVLKKDDLEGLNLVDHSDLDDSKDSAEELEKRIKKEEEEKLELEQENKLKKEKQPNKEINAKKGRKIKEAKSKKKRTRSRD